MFKKPIIAYKKGSSNEVILSAFWGNLSFIDCVFKDQVNFRETIDMVLQILQNHILIALQTLKGVSFNQNTYFTIRSF